MNQTKSLKVRIGGLDTQAQGAVHWQQRQQHLPLLFLQALGGGRKGYVTWQCVGIVLKYLIVRPPGKEPLSPLSFYIGP